MTHFTRPWSQTRARARSHTQSPGAGSGERVFQPHERREGAAGAAGPGGAGGNRTAREGGGPKWPMAPVLIYSEVGFNGSVPGAV